MTDLVLSKTEVAELARSSHKAKQIAFLLRNGIRHYLDAHGWPVVLRSSVEEGAATAPAARASWKSNKAA